MKGFSVLWLFNNVKEEKMSDEDSFYREKIVDPILHNWGLLCFVETEERTFDFRVSCQGRHLLAIVRLDDRGNPYWLLELSDSMRERGESLQESGAFPVWFLEWNGIDLIVSPEKKTSVFSLDSSALVYLIAYLFGVDRLGIRSWAPFPYLAKKTRALLMGKPFQWTPFGYGRQPESSWYLRIADVFILWKRQMQELIQAGWKHQGMRPNPSL